MPEEVPLTTMLSWVWVAHVIEADNAFEAAAGGAEGMRRPFRISIAMWANGLRHIAEDGTAVDELQRRARARCNIGGLERWGWISAGERGAARRAGYGTSRGVKGDTVLHPTRAGAYAKKLWPRVVDDVEYRWRSRFGSAVIDALGDAATRTTAPREAPDAMPWSPPEVHPSDGFRTHVVAGDVAEGERPLFARLGQVLTALTIELEPFAGISLPLGADVMRVIGADVVRLRDLPALAGVSREGIAMAAGFLRRRGLAVSAPGPAIRLTESGLSALERYQRVASRPEDVALRAALGGVISQRNALSAGLVSPKGCWRGERPYLAQTQRLVADPVRALPWQPMVLHRGGWPDAS